MLRLGQYKAIAVLLLALCLLASFTYLKVWSTINTNAEDDIRREKEAKSSQYQHKHSDDSNQFRDSTVHAEIVEAASIDTDGVINSLLPPTIDLTSLTSSSSSSFPGESAQRSSPKITQETIEKQRHQEFKALSKQEKQERQRKKEEGRLRKIVRLQRLQKLNSEPYPALISTNNARVSTLNLKAFERFCHVYSRSHEGKEEEKPEIGLATAERVSENTGRGAVSKQDFKTFEDWREYIRSKNLGQEQQYPLSSSPLTEDTISEQQEEPLHRIYRSDARPLFWERPLRGWIVNYSAILEPCDRTKHTSAHCLSYLTQDHLYLVPSRQARAFPNRPHTVASDSVVRPEDMELEQSVGQNHDENAMPESFTAPTTATPAMMHFHIFWRGVVTDKLSLASHAFLFTQPLDRARLHLWIDSTDLPGGQPEDYSQNTFAKDLVSPPLNRFVKIHMWDQEAQETYAYPALMTDLDSNNRDGQQQGQEQSGPNATAAILPVALSDEARFLILYHYGGMYLDADVLLLRDMSPLYDSGMEFAYEWSNTQQYNTAVLRLNRGGGVARRVLDGAKAKEKEIQGRQMGKEEITVVQGEKPDDRSGEKEFKTMEEGSNSKNRTRGRPKQQEERPSKASSIELHAVEDSEGEDSLGHSNGDSLFASDTTIASITPHRLTKRKEMRPDEIYHPARLRQYLDPQNGAVANNGLVMMPTAIFDPLWLRVDDVESTSGLESDKEKMMEDLKTFPDAFTNKDAICPAQAQLGGDQDFMAGPEVFFTGAYAYHWHNNWLTPIAEHSWMGLMHKAYTEFLAGERPNLYGEWFQDDSKIPFTKR
ncbi:hypothetical protein BGZ98_000868 [Dissophora globulifera]|nr:hypothetical protein BGZ98_000868 [Dissophora globulifera]